MLKDLRVKITDIHPQDGYFSFRDQLIGQIGTFAGKDFLGKACLGKGKREGYFYGEVTFSSPIHIERLKDSPFYFYGVKFEILGEAEPKTYGEGRKEAKDE